jgi:hypothetical protein
MATRTNSGRRKGAPKFSRTKASKNGGGKRGKPQGRAQEKPGSENIAAAIREIGNTVFTLTSVHSTSVAVYLALDGQNAEQDNDLARCVRLQITNVVDNVVERLVAVARRLGGTIGNPLL